MNADTDIYIDLAKRSFEPGARISGTILWALAESPEELHLSLGWWTEGRGTKDAKIEAELHWPITEPVGEKTFEIQAPETPYSFDGHLIALKWALEIRSKDGKYAHAVNVTIAPFETPIELPLVDDESQQKPFSFFGTRQH